MTGRRARVARKYLQVFPSVLRAGAVRCLRAARCGKANPNYGHRGLECRVLIAGYNRAACPSAGGWSPFRMVWISGSR